MKRNVLSRLRFPALPCTEHLFTGFLMALIAGFVDVFCFVEVNRLFTAHITGNLVIAITEIITHTPGVVAKLIALPIFLIIVMIITSIIEKVGQTKRLLYSLLVTEAVLLTLFMIIGHFIIPLGDVRSWEYISTGMLAVGAMAIHNTLLRTFMISLPPCTVMTGNFCQWIVDLVSYLWGKKLKYPIENVQISIRGIKQFGTVLLSFGLGGLIAALGIVTIGFWSVLFSILTLLFMIAWVNFS